MIEHPVLPMLREYPADIEIVSHEGLNNCMLDGTHYKTFQECSKAAIDHREKADVRGSLKFDIKLTFAESGHELTVHPDVTKDFDLELHIVRYLFQRAIGSGFYYRYPLKDDELKLVKDLLLAPVDFDAYDNGLPDSTGPMRPNLIYACSDEEYKKQIDNSHLPTFSEHFYRLSEAVDENLFRWYYEIAEMPHRYSFIATEEDANSILCFMIYTSFTGNLPIQYRKYYAPPTNKGGRPRVAQPLKQRSIRLTDDELEKVKAYVKELRAK